MITPQFSVDQDTDFVYIKIRAPYIRASEVEFTVQENVFIFSLPPYYLRLRFPSSLLDSSGEDARDLPEEKRSHASYDLGSSLVNVRVPKETPGEEFKDLDMLTKLLARQNEDTSQREKSQAPLIQEVEGQEQGQGQGQEVESIAKAGEEFDWEVEQQVPESLGPEDTVHIPTTNRYGFNDQYSGELEVSIMNGNDVNEIDDPERSTPESRRKERIEKEDDKFDPEYYLADYFDNPMIGEIIEWNSGSLLNDLKAQFTLEESDQLSKLPKKKYLIDNPKSIYVNLLSIVFGWAYDTRVNMGDRTVESAWTMGKLIPGACALDMSASTIKSMAVTCTRRALAYPLYRHDGLVKRVWDDVYEVLRMAAEDKRVIVRILLQVLSAFDTGDHCYYVYNTILFRDYAAWVQECNQTVLRSMAHELRRASQEIEDNRDQELGWNLKEFYDMALEQLARAQGEGQDSDDE